MTRARELKIPFGGITGKYNAITDVKGVEVGFKTIIEGDGKKGGKAVRTGVTAVLPRGRKRSAVFAGRYDLNGNGELTGTHWIDDSGFLHGPVMITNTNSVGVVRDAASRWMVENDCFYPSYNGGEVAGYGYFYPVTGETFDGLLNSINEFTVKKEDALEAIKTAKSGEVEEGCVGGGTGMVCHEFKGGTGTASRVTDKENGEYTVGVLVQANHGRREELVIAGIPFGKEIKDCETDIRQLSPKPGTGSIIAVIATDAPVLPWQLTKMCKRAPLGIGKLGGGNATGSGDIFIAFSTANEHAFSYDQSNVTLLSDEKMDPLYKAVEEAVEEAIVNALVAANDMYGRDGNYVPALPHDQVKEILKKYDAYISQRYGENQN